MPEDLPPPTRPPTRLAGAPPNGHERRAPPFINLCGDYRFLRAGYWALVDAELNGFTSRPTPMQAVTAQNAAACLLVAKQAGIPTVNWRLARKPEDITPPALLVQVAGLTDTSFQVNSTRSAATQLRRASQNATRPVIAVDLAQGPLRSMKMVVGVTTADNYQFAWDLWTTFAIPLAEVWYVEAGDPDDGEASKPLFLGIDPLPLHELTERELRLLEEVSQRPMSPS